METVYHKTIQDLLRQIDAKISETESFASDELTEVDYSNILFNLFQTKRKLQRMLEAHRFLRISKEAFLNKEKPTQFREIIHTVTQYDTIFEIAKKYGVTVEEILQNNNISIANIQTGTELKIIQPNSLTLKNIREDYPIYGEIDDTNILGNDLPNRLADNESGDLVVLQSNDTFVQGIMNRLTTQEGDYLGEDDFGFSYNNKDGLEEDVFINMMKIKIYNLLTLDARIQSVGDVEIVRSAQESNSLKINIPIQTINQQDITVRI